MRESTPLAETLTAERARELFNYDPETGALTWKPRQGQGARNDRTGQLAGSPHADGYIAVQVGRRKYMAHRVCWLIVTGAWPTDEIDHRSRHRADNRFANLRDVSKAVNQQNRGNVTGVDFHKATQRWRARITAGGKCMWLGLFREQATAEAAYARAKEVLHA